NPPGQSPAHRLAMPELSCRRAGGATDRLIADHAAGICRPAGAANARSAGARAANATAGTGTASVLAPQSQRRAGRDVAERAAVNQVLTAGFFKAPEYW